MGQTATDGRVRKTRNRNLLAWPHNTMTAVLGLHHIICRSLVYRITGKNSEDAAVD